MSTNINPNDNSLTQSLEKLNNFFHEDIAQALTHYVRSYVSWTTASLSEYKNLPFRDKLCLTSRLEFDILPSLITPPEDEQRDRGNSESHSDTGQDTDKVIYDSEQEDDNNPGRSDPLNHFEYGIMSETSPVNESKYHDESTLGVLNHKADLDLSSTHSRIIQALTSLNPLAGEDISSHTFQNNLCYFIMQCHSHQCNLPCHNNKLGNLDPAAEAILSRILSQDQQTLTYSNLRHICSSLGVTVSGSQLTSTKCIKELCHHYCFPCPGVIFPWEQILPNDQNILVMNKILNMTISRPLVTTELTGHISTHSSLWCYPDKIKIKSVHPRYLITNGTPRFQDHSPEHDMLDGYQTMAKMVNIDSSDQGMTLRTMIHTLLRKDSFHGKFIECNGQIGREFQDFTCVDTFQRRHNFWLLEPDTISELLTQFNLHPIVVPHITSYLSQRDICVYDTPHSVTHIFVNHKSSEKTIKYTYNTLEVTPSFSCAIFFIDSDGAFHIKKSNHPPPQHIKTIPPCHYIWKSLRVKLQSGKSSNP
jgi:hypothetical protein